MNSWKVTLDQPGVAQLRPGRLCLVAFAHETPYNEHVLECIAECIMHVIMNCRHCFNV